MRDQSDDVPQSRYLLKEGTMATAYLSPYLNFDGNCREAMEFYQSALGGKLEVSTFGELFPDESPDRKDKIMHAMLQNDVLILMASDSPPGMEYNIGNHVSLSLAGTDAEQLKRYWDALSQGGNVIMPLEKQVWGDEFGMFADKFGMTWMVNISQE
jgi:PhnB protein